MKFIQRISEGYQSLDPDLFLNLATVPDNQGRAASRAHAVNVLVYQSTVYILHTSHKKLQLSRESSFRIAFSFFTQ